MILLTIDTSANFCAAALYDCGKNKMLASRSEDIGRGHAERLMGLLGEVFENAKLEYIDVGKIAATCGPGSFTGIRVGLATARGLALGLGIPVIGINVLEAIAFQHNSNGAGQINQITVAPILVALDAKRGEVFMQLFSGAGENLSEPMAVPINQIPDFLPTESFRLAGSASKIIVETIGSSTDHQISEICSDQSAANIDGIVKLAAKSSTTLRKPTPLYLRSADAKPQNNFAVNRIAS